MSVPVILGALVGMGCLGVIRGLRAVPPTLDFIAAELERSVEVGRSTDRDGRRPDQWGGATVTRLIDRNKVTREKWGSLGPYLAITGDRPDQVASQMLIAGGVGLLAPPLAWLALRVTGVTTTIPMGIALVVALIASPLGIAVPVLDLVARARARQHHVRVVVGSFVDLVGLNLAGGMGIESSLLVSAQVTSDWAAQRISRSLLKARDSGQASWVALSQLGTEIGVPELVELSTTLQLAGTEGTRIRQSLSARAVALRRHEQADAEAAANTTTERLFIPGALLLIGFLVFVGYPAFSRILGGF